MIIFATNHLNDMTARKLVGAAAAMVLMAASAVSAQTSTTSTSTPGVPETGSGGAATVNVLMLAATGLAAAMGVAVLARRMRTE